MFNDEIYGTLDTWLDDVLWYLTEYPEHRAEIGATFKKGFSEMVDKLITELNEQDAEEDY